jgi:hypothetical protein
MGIFTDLVGSLMDMGKLSILMKTLESEIEVLKKSGKCPEGLEKKTKTIDVEKLNKK